MIHPCPTAAWLPATLAWDLSNFWETEGLDEPSAPSLGTLCHCWGSVLTEGCGSATSPPNLRAPVPPSWPLPPARVCCCLSRSFLEENTTTDWGPRHPSSASAPASASKFCARPKQSPFPAFSFPIPSAVPGCEGWPRGRDPLPALSQGGKPPAQRCHGALRDAAIASAPGWEKLSRALPPRTERRALRGAQGGGGPSSFPSQPSSGPPFTAARNVWPAQPGSPARHRHEFLLLTPLPGPPEKEEPPRPRGGAGGTGTSEVT